MFEKYTDKYLNEARKLTAKEFGKWKQEREYIKQMADNNTSSVYKIADYVQFLGLFTQRQWEMFMYGRYEKDLQKTDPKTKNKIYKVLQRMFESESVNESLTGKLKALYKAGQKAFGKTKIVPPNDADYETAEKYIEMEYGKGHSLFAIGVDKIQDVINIQVGDDKTRETEDIVIDRPAENANEAVMKGKYAGNKLKSAEAGKTLTMDDKTYTSLGKGKWKGPDGEKLSWVEVSAMASALGNKEVIYEAKVTAKTIDKLTNEIAVLTKELKDNFALYKKAKTDEDKKKHMQIAADKTKEKRAKDAELEKAIQNFGADMELDITFENKDLVESIKYALNEKTAKFVLQTAQKYANDADAPKAYIKDYLKSIERMARKSPQLFVKRYGDYSRDDWEEDVIYNLQNESINEARRGHSSTQFFDGVRANDGDLFHSKRHGLAVKKGDKLYLFYAWEGEPKLGKVYKTDKLHKHLGPATPELVKTYYGDAEKAMADYANKLEESVNENENRVYGMFTDDQGKPTKLDKELLAIALKGLPSKIVKNIDAVEANGYGKSSHISPPTVSNKGQSRGEIEYHTIGIGLLKPMGKNKITAITLGLRKRTSGPGTGYLYMKVAPDWRHTLGPDAQGAIEFWDDPSYFLQKLYNEKFKNWF